MPPISYARHRFPPVPIQRLNDSGSFSSANHAPWHEHTPTICRRFYVPGAQASQNAGDPNFYAPLRYRILASAFQLRFVSTAHILSLVGSRPAIPNQVLNPALAAMAAKVFGVK